MERITSECITQLHLSQPSDWKPLVLQRTSPNLIIEIIFSERLSTQIFSHFNESSCPNWNCEHSYILTFSIKSTSFWLLMSAILLTYFIHLDLCHHNKICFNNQNSEHSSCNCLAFDPSFSDPNQNEPGFGRSRELILFSFWYWLFSKLNRA